MNVLEFLDFEGKDFDIGDKTYDITVTCCQSSDFAQALKDGCSARYRWSPAVIIRLLTGPSS